DAGAELFEFAGGGFFPTRRRGRVIDIRAVSHLVKHGLRVGPKPGDRPEQPAEDKREETEALNSPELRMTPVVGTRFGEDMDQQEDRDQDDRGDDEREPGNDVRD